MKSLDNKIVRNLVDKLHIREATIKKDIYLLAKNYPQCTKNALAQIYAQKRGVSIFPKLDREDRATLPAVTEVVRERITAKKGRIKSQEKKVKALFDYETSDYWKRGHIDELNRAYTYGCYTSVFILARKIVENMIIDILKKKFPENKKRNKELYFNISQKRFQDFGIILGNLLKKKDSFGTNNSAVKRLYDLSIPFKSDSNDKTHSWFHLVRDVREISALQLGMIIELIKTLEKTVGLRRD